MRQHLNAQQLKELDYENRITLIALVIGVNKEYMKNEYSKGLKNEDAMLLEYGYKVNVGELMEIVQSYTGQFPIPTINNEMFELNLIRVDRNGEKENMCSGQNSEYIDALYEIVKMILAKGYIEIL